MTTSRHPGRVTPAPRWAFGHWPIYGILLLAIVCAIYIKGGFKPGGLESMGGGGPVAAVPASPGEMTVARFLVNHGFDVAAAAAITGTAYGESRDNPESVGTGGAGLIGWTPPSSAAPLQPIVTGNVRRDMGVQLVDMLAFIRHNGSVADMNRYRGSLSQAMAAAWHFSAVYERPLVTGSDIRGTVIAAVYAALTKKAPAHSAGRKHRRH